MRTFNGNRYPRDTFIHSVWRNINQTLEPKRDEGEELENASPPIGRRLFVVLVELLEEITISGTGALPNVLLDVPASGTVRGGSGCVLFCAPRVFGMSLALGGAGDGPCDKTSASIRRNCISLPRKRANGGRRTRCI